MPESTIYYCGNPLLDFDSLPEKIIPDLKKIFPKINFIHHDPAENIRANPGNNRYDLIFIDTVINAADVIAITDPKQLAGQNLYSPHDWDLAFNLKLLLQLGEIKNFLVIGVPPQENLEAIIQKICKIIRKL